MRLSFNLKFWLLIALQIAIIIFFIGYIQYHLAKGEEIVLKVIPPRDPLSLLQGHYLALNYEISQLEAGKYLGPSDFRAGETIFVILEKKDKYYTYYAVSRQRPKRGSFIVGKIISNYKGNLRITYGIENYFIPEEMFEEIEEEFRKATREKEVFVKVSINKFGHALIKEILIDGARFDLSRLKKIEKEIRFKKIEKEIRYVERGRDGRRILDLHQIQTALKLYFDKNGFYPGELSQLVPSYLTSLPKDPLTNQDYFYATYPAINPLNYHLGAALEDLNSYYLNNDADFNSIEAGFINGFNGLDPVYDIVSKH